MHRVVRVTVWFLVVVAVAIASATTSRGVVIASDDFDRTDELPLVVGGTWQQVAGAGSADLTGGRVVGAVGDVVYGWQGPGVFDDTHQYARARVAATTGQVGLALLTGPGQAIVVAWDRSVTTLYVYWYSSTEGQKGNLTTAIQTIEVGDVVEAELVGGTIYAKRNGVVVASVANTTSLSSGRPGFETFRAGGALDDWEAGTLPSHSLTGSITENGVPLTGAFVRASGSFAGSAATDAGGVYVIPNVPDGASSIVVTPNLAGHTLSPTSRTVPGPVAADVTDQDFSGVPSSNPRVAWDDFDRGPEAPLVVGGTWQKVAGTGSADLAGDRVVGGVGDVVYGWQGPGVFDDTHQYARAHVAATTGQVGLALLTGPGQAIVVAWDRSVTTLYVYWYSSTGGYQGNLTTAIQTIEVGDVVEAELVDGTIYAKRNGVVVASVANTTSLSSGRPGFETFRAGGALDDWEAGNATPTAPPVPGLSPMGEVALACVLAAVAIVAAARDRRRSPTSG